MILLNCPKNKKYAFLADKAYDRICHDIESRQCNISKLEVRFDMFCVKNRICCRLEGRLGRRRDKQLLSYHSEVLRTSSKRHSRMYHSETKAGLVPQDAKLENHLAMDPVG